MKPGGGDDDRHTLKNTTIPTDMIMADRKSEAFAQTAEPPNRDDDDDDDDDLTTEASTTATTTGFQGGRMIHPPPSLGPLVRNQDEEEDDNEKPRPLIPARPHRQPTEQPPTHHHPDDDDDDEYPPGENNHQNHLPWFQYRRSLSESSLPRRRPADPSESNTDHDAPPLLDACTCAIMGKMVLTPDTTVSFLDHYNNNNNNSHHHHHVVVDSSTTSSPAASSLHPSSSTATFMMEAWQGQTMHVMVLGTAPGDVWMVQAGTGQVVARPTQLPLFPHPAPLVALSLDATGTCLAALDLTGQVALAEIKYTLALVSSDTTNTTTTTTAASGTATSHSTSPSSTHPPAAQQVFSSWMSALTGGGGSSGSAAATPTRPTNATSPTPTSTASSSSRPDARSAARTDRPSTPGEGTDSAAPARVWALVVHSCQVTRVQYPAQWGPPTCLALDPAYKKKREKSFMVGWADGRLILTKRGFVFQRRTDAVLYQAVAAPSPAEPFRGIEALAWRGNLVAWADVSGIRLLDADSLTRIAHIDRPTGARPSLYPTLTQLTPSLCFETSHKLLVAWGDCLLSLTVRESSVSPARGLPQVTPGGGPLAGEAGSAGPLIRKHTVECTMAWQLDCVACGVVPLDATHVVVLGLVPPDLEEEEGGEYAPGLEGDDHQEGRDPRAKSPVGSPDPPPRPWPEVNDVELQVISRLDGTIVYADMLPLVRPRPPPPKPSRGLALRRSPRDGTPPPSSPEVASSFRLLSSFSVPRMDDAAELQEEGPDLVDDFDPLQTSLFGSSSSEAHKKKFVDAHLKWDMKLLSFDRENPAAVPVGDGTDDNDSVDSDDYAFIRRPLGMTDEAERTRQAPPPTLVVVSALDAVHVRTLDVDDAVSFALAQGRPALALRRAIGHLRQLRAYTLTELVDGYFRALLRLGDAQPSSAAVTARNNKSPPRHLSLRRMKLAAEAMPVLLGGQVELWSKWVAQMERIPGALFVVRNYLPVRDPILPKELYGRVLKSMLEQVEQMMTSSADSTMVERLEYEAEVHFLNTLIGWGSSRGLKEYMKLFNYQSDQDGNASSLLRVLSQSLQRREEQTAAVYLQFPVPGGDQLATPSATFTGDRIADEGNDSLYDVGDLLAHITERVPLLSQRPLPKPNPSNRRLNSRVGLLALAQLRVMEGAFDQALACYLIMGDLHATRSLVEIEEEALQATRVGESNVDDQSPFAFVIHFIERHHLHQYLLDSSFLPDDMDSLPLFALLRLVGLGRCGRFLIEHCVGPHLKAGRPNPSDGQISPVASGKPERPKERLGTLPLDLVSDQLDANPKLLLWYLHLIFTRKPELYVKFPTTANPPAAITNLHRKQVDLYIKYAGTARDSALVVKEVEAYRVSEQSTPLLSFLKAVLNLGGISPVEVGKLLEVERRGGAGVSRIFALELAYIMEQFGDDSENEARLILELYFKGAESLILAVSYAQRTRKYSQFLWETLITHCLIDERKDSSTTGHVDGAKFGSLMEAAALSGADLAGLVKQIPRGMSIEGLRPKLAAAVVDYRLKLKLHERSSEIAVDDKKSLLRELSHRIRRGMRYKLSDEAVRQPEVAVVKEAAAAKDKIEKTQLPSRTRTVERRDQFTFVYSLPIR